MGHGRGRHSKPKTSNLKRNVAYGAAITVGGVAIPSTFTGTANATTEDAWDKVAQCESSGLWNRPDGDFGKSSGGLQFQPASWSDALAYLRSQGVDTSGYPQGPGHQAYKATKQQQIMAGEALLALQGPGAWTCNAKVGSPLGASMFKGGPKPFATVTPPTKPKPPPPVTPKPSTGKPAASSDVWHTVKRGEYLSKIARDHLGDASKWRQIYSWNQRKIKNPNLIYPGQVLKVDVRVTAPPPATPAAPAPAKAAPPQAPRASGYVLPVQGRIGDGLMIGSGGSMSRSAGGHSGLDIVAPAGTAVVSAAAGTVVGIGGAGAAYGNHVIIKHAEGVYTLYAHLAGDTVSLGQAVSAGQRIGYVGSTGNSSGPHLHFEVRSQPTSFSPGVFSNPAVWLRSHGVTV